MHEYFLPAEECYGMEGFVCLEPSEQRESMRRGVNCFEFELHGLTFVKAHRSSNDPRQAQSGDSDSHPNLMGSGCDRNAAKRKRRKIYGHREEHQAPSSSMPVSSSCRQADSSSGEDSSARRAGSSDKDSGSTAPTCTRGATADGSMGRMEAAPRTSTLYSNGLILPSLLVLNSEDAGSMPPPSAMQVFSNRSHRSDAVVGRQSDRDHHAWAGDNVDSESGNFKSQISYSLELELTLSRGLVLPTPHSELVDADGTCKNITKNNSPHHLTYAASTKDAVPSQPGLSPLQVKKGRMWSVLHLFS
ncbi:hypothetical protein EON64_02245 [archaeon]|nr:MAG: hypothetical protein EON64_02245 [archaeon]